MLTVELQCRVLELDHTQPAGIHFLFSAGVFLILFFLFCKCRGVTMALDGG